MITVENYEELVRDYAALKIYIKELKLSKEEFLDNIKNATPVGVRVVEFLKKLEDGENVKKNLEELVRVIYD